MLLCWGAALLLLPALACLWKLEWSRPRSMLPAVLLTLGLWLHAPLVQFAAQCATALLDSTPLLFFDRAFGGVLPS